MLGVLKEMIDVTPRFPNTLRYKIYKSHIPPHHKCIAGRYTQPVKSVTYMQV